MPGNPSKIGLTAKDMGTLTSNGMVNDEIINFTLGMLQMSANSDISGNGSQRWLFLHSFFMEKLYS